MRKALAALLVLECTLLTLLVSCYITVPTTTQCPDPHPEDPTWPWIDCDKLEPSTDAGADADAGDAADDADPDAGDDAGLDGGADGG